MTLSALPPGSADLSSPGDSTSLRSHWLQLSPFPFDKPGPPTSPPAATHTHLCCGIMELIGRYVSSQLGIQATYSPHYFLLELGDTMF